MGVEGKCNLFFFLFLVLGKFFKIVLLYIFFWVKGFLVIGRYKDKFSGYFFICRLKVN